jgi:hypothetical protein
VCLGLSGILGSLCVWIGSLPVFVGGLSAFGDFGMDMFGHFGDFGLFGNPPNSG